MLSCHRDLKLHDSLKISFKALLKQGLWIWSHRLSIETTENLSWDFRKPFSHRWVSFSETNPEMLFNCNPFTRRLPLFLFLKCLPDHVHSYSKIQPQIFTLSWELTEIYIFMHHACTYTVSILSLSKHSCKLRGYNTILQVLITTFNPPKNYCRRLIYYLELGQ